MAEKVLYTYVRIANVRIRIDPEKHSFSQLKKLNKTILKATNFLYRINFIGQMKKKMLHEN